MAIMRTAPTCAHCGAVIATAIYQDQSDIPPIMRIIGDTFIRWDYIYHECEAGKKFAEQIRKQCPTLSEKFNPSNT